MAHVGEHPTAPCLGAVGGALYDDEQTERLVGAVRVIAPEAIGSGRYKSASGHDA
jgi:hypothetical protein